MAEVPQTDDESEPEVKTVTDGYFEEEYYVDAGDAAEFLADLSDQLRSENEITISGEEWELPFAFGEPVKLDIEFEGDGEPELEIEVELEGRIEDETPEIN